MSILQVKNLTHTYGGDTPFINDAVSEVSFTVDAGEIIGIIGHTGSGKSTLVQMFNGLIKPDSGKVLVNGKDIWEKPKEISKVRYTVGMVMQYPEYQLFADTVWEDIAYGPRNMKLSEGEVKERVERSARFCGISKETLEKSPFQHPFLFLL